MGSYKRLCKATIAPASYHLTTNKVNVFTHSASLSFIYTKDFFFLSLNTSLTNKN